MLPKKASKNLTLLAFQLIEDADKSPQENKNTKLAFEGRPHPVTPSPHHPITPSLPIPSPVMVWSSFFQGTIV